MPSNQMDATPEEQQAYRLLYDQIHAPVFFEKLAERGVEPQSEQEVQALLMMGANLMQTQTLERQKRASSQEGSFILKAAQSLDAALRESGLALPSSTAVDQVIKSASYQVAKDPAVQQAAITYQGYLARQAG
jgi:hypothetical protein